MTDYEHFLSTTGRHLHESAIRRMGTVVARAGDLVSFAPGYPDSTLFPWAELREIALELLNGQDGSTLQYGPTRGHQPLIESIVSILEGRGIDASAEEVLITSGSQQGLDLAARVLVSPGEVVLVELPTFTGGIAAFRNVEAELVGVRQLYDQHLVQISRLTTLERDAARLSGERAQYIAQRAQSKGKITETELQIIQVDKDMVSEVSKDLRETNDKIGEFVERKVTAEDQLRRIDIRAPQDGMVLQSTVHTVGGVITAGDAIMMIVPQADDLSVEAKVNPQDIDKLQIGQKTVLRLSAFNQRTGQSYYTIRVSMPPEEVKRLGDTNKIIPGMPVEAFVQTGDRTMLSYLMKPLSDQFMRAFREK